MFLFMDVATTEWNVLQCFLLKSTRAIVIALIQDNFNNIRLHDLLFLMSKWLNKVLVDVFLVDRMVLYTSQDSFFGINVAYVRKFL